MTTIYIPRSVPALKLYAIRSHLSYVAMHDPNWNGAKFEILPTLDGCASIDCSEKLSGAVLLNEICEIIEEAA